jgi:hypothetical protein
MENLGKICSKIIICFCFSFFILDHYLQAEIKGQSEDLPDTAPSIYVENLDKFPANDRLTFSKVHIPWKREFGDFNANHDLVTLRITNKGNGSLIINNFQISNNSFFAIHAISDGKTLPITLNTRQSVNVTVKFIAGDQGNIRVKILNETLKINSNDLLDPSKTIYLHGLWQKQGEDVHEPNAQEIINAFGFKTNTGFIMSDPDKGDPTKLKGDEVISPYFVRADVTKPVYVRQMAAYHGCCTDSETFRYHLKGSTNRVTIFTHHNLDGQSLLPRLQNSSAPAEKSFSPPANSAFGFIVNADYTDRDLNMHTNFPDDNNKIGIRIWKAKDPQGNIIPNTYILANDYLGSQWTNYDYNDNLYYVTNIRPEVGSAHFSVLKSTPSALKFGEKEIGSTNSLSVTLQNLGKTYNPGPNDPVINITSVQVVGQNADDFTASAPASSIVNPQASTNLSVQFKPLSGGIKNAELLIHYNFSLSPLRIPLYGIASNECNVITNLHRIKSGSSTDLTVDGLTWKSDYPYRKGNALDDKPANLSEIAGTDDDALYINYLSSTSDLNELNYEIPVENGELMVRLHFSENYWSLPGERVFTVKMENQTKLLNFDILKEVPTKTTLVKDFNVSVSDGVLNLKFNPTVNRLSLAAVEVYSLDNSGSPTLNTVEVNNPTCDNEDGSIQVAVASSQSATYKIGASGTYQASGLFSNLAPGKYVVFARVGTESCEVSKEFEIIAEDCPNNPPVVSNPVADQSVKEGTAFSFTFPENTFTDSDAGDEITYCNFRK